MEKKANRTHANGWNAAIADDRGQLGTRRASEAEFADQAAVSFPRSRHPGVAADSSAQNDASSKNRTRQNLSLDDDELANISASDVSRRMPFDHGQSARFSSVEAPSFVQPDRRLSTMVEGEESAGSSSDHPLTYHEFDLIAKLPPEINRSENRSK